MGACVQGISLDVEDEIQLNFSIRGNEKILISSPGGSQKKKNLGSLQSAPRFCYDMINCLILDGGWLASHLWGF